MPFCGVVQAINVVDHTILFGARNVSLQSIAANLATLPPVAEFGCPVVNKTGLAGAYDFSLNWLPDRNGLPLARASAQGAARPQTQARSRSSVDPRHRPRRRPIVELATMQTIKRCRGRRGCRILSLSSPIRK